MLIIFGSDNLFFLISLLVTLNHIHAAQQYKEGKKYTFNLDCNDL